MLFRSEAVGAAEAAKPCCSWRVPCPQGEGRAFENFLRKALTSAVLVTIVRGFPDGGIPKRSTGSDCKSDGSAFEGSNPSPSTKVSVVPCVVAVDVASAVSVASCGERGKVRGGKRIQLQACAGVAQW